MCDGRPVPETNKAVVRRLVDEVMNAGHMDVVDDIYAPQLAPTARRWIARFRESFPDVHMTIVDLIAEADKVVGRFTCSGTHRGTWRGHPPPAAASTTSPRCTSSPSTTAASPPPGDSRTPTVECSRSASRSAPKTPQHDPSPILGQGTERILR
jgi:hypothetical protein